MSRPPQRLPLFPHTSLSRSRAPAAGGGARRRRPLYKDLSLQILVAMVLGSLVGYLWGQRYPTRLPSTIATRICSERSLYSGRLRRAPPPAAGALDRERDVWGKRGSLWGGRLI